MVACLIHNLEVAGSNPEVGNIFSERYLENWGYEEKERETENEMRRKCKGGKDMGTCKPFLRN